MWGKFSAAGWMSWTILSTQHLHLYHFQSSFVSEARITQGVSAHFASVWANFLDYEQLRTAMDWGLKFCSIFSCFLLVLINMGAYDYLWRVNNKIEFNCRRMIGEIEFIWSLDFFSYFGIFACNFLLCPDIKEHKETSHGIADRNFVIFKRIQIKTYNGKPYQN